MFKKHEASRLKQEFWTTFGRYMSPVLSAEGGKINWINYHTGIKDIYFRMDADSSSAEIAISIEHHDGARRKRLYKQFTTLRPVLHDTLGEEWIWDPERILADGREVARIYKQLPGLTVFRRDDWPDLISFFKPRIIALDAFWENAKWAFHESGFN